MKKFDKMMKQLSREINVPESYNKKVDKVLHSVMEKEEKDGKRKMDKWVFRLAACLIGVICLLSVSAFDVHADIFSFFKQTIMDFLGRNVQDDIGEMGVESNEIYVAGKPDLMLELQETVIDSHSIYLLVRITAPSDIEFSEKISFDYFCFCKGQNYNNSQLLSGTKSCELLEVSEERTNIATYVVSMVFDEELEEGSEVTACFKDLELEPYSDKPQMLVEGMWSVTFPLERTVTDSITIQGTSDMTFSYHDTTAVLKEMELTPLGMVVLSDISEFPEDELGTSDTTIAIRLKMIDGSEQTIVSHNPKEEGYVQGGSSSFSEENGRTYQKDTLEFTNMVNISKISGVYIEDLYVSVK